MKIFKLRGQKIGYEGNNLYLTIRKTQGEKFSISDNLLGMLVRKNMVLHVKLNGTEQIITKDTPRLFKESVPSKFPGLPPWQRHWFAVISNNNNQKKLF